MTPLHLEKYVTTAKPTKQTLKATLCNYCSSAAIGEDKPVTSWLLVICVALFQSVLLTQNTKLQFCSAVKRRLNRTQT